LGSERPALLTDFYELTMMGGYYRHGRHGMEVVFEYYFRSLPDEFGFAVFAGQPVEHANRNVHRRTFEQRARRLDRAAYRELFDLKLPISNPWTDHCRHVLFING